MPFLRQAYGLGLRPKPRLLPNHAVSHPATIRFASHSNKHKKTRVCRDSQRQTHSDHDGTGSSRRQKPFWESITPDFLTQEIETSSRKNGHFAQVSAFKFHASHKPGSKPHIEASSTSWNSNSNEVSHTVYDPISGRMVPASDGQSRTTPTSTSGEKNNKIFEKAYHKPTVVSQLSDDVATLTDTTTTHSSLTEDFDKIYQSEHDELLAARRQLDTLREQIQILERQAHPEMTKPQYAIDAERPAVFEDGWDNDPKGLQTAFELEKQACEHGEMKPLEEEMDALNKRPIQAVNDDYSVAPSGMQTLFADEQKDNEINHKSSLEQELVAMNTSAPPLEDGYSKSPQGLETLFQQEKQEAEHGQRESLEDEVRATGTAEYPPQYSDSFTEGSARLETMYHREQESTPERLEHELENMPSCAATKDPNDAYSTEPIGMQTLYEREVEAKQKGQHRTLEDELHDHIQARNSADDLLPDLEGMQTLWTREQREVEGGRAESLEEEIKAREQSSTITDENDRLPAGMESHFSNETQRNEDGKSKTLEEEMSRMLQAQTHVDDHSDSLGGLETAFDKEEKDTILGKRRSLEKEIDTLGSAFEDGYSTMPMGHQMMYRMEKENNERSLEEDIKQMEEASYHEDGYSRAPIGMESSFEREVNDKSASLEADLRNMPGEGDLSPTVGKFNNSNMWYKQPARSTFSEDYQKADVKELDQRTTVFGRSLDERSSDSVNPSVSLPKTATAAKSGTTTNESESNSSDASPTPELKANITWADPALYKVIAYDSSKDAITITTTPSNFSDSEKPISIPRAISQLAQTARFLPHLATSQSQGFQVIHAEKDFLILRKVFTDSHSKTPQYDGDVNPVDGTTKHIPIEPAAARFASPTGFVNYEPIFPTEPVRKHTSASNLPSEHSNHEHPEFQQQTYYPSSHHSAQLRERQYALPYNKPIKERPRRWRRRIVWLLSVAAGTAVSTAYVAGVSGELARPDKYVVQSAK
ncbi:hypothetical protein QM012_004367 [Aureobasidium pullulans]|uniref:Uncharacterized protein n=1 Tax=Aureobasidium pullulans TaxID=5580 RepID=A0ABR0TSY9_AURPU